jgi:PAS domain S-box-containing protein
MKLKQFSLTIIIYITVISAVVISVIPVISLWIKDRNSIIEQHTSKHTTEQIKNRKNELYIKTENIIALLNRQRDAAEKKMREGLINEVSKAHSIASNIYYNFNNKLSSADVETLIKESLRAVRFNNGRGYFFIASMQGKEILYPVAPQLENTNVLDLQDDAGNYVVRDEIKFVREKGEGFIKGLWRKPEISPNGMSYPKLTYLRSFKELNWYIGTGDYLDDFDTSTKQDALDFIESVPLEDNETLMTITLDGTILYSRDTAKNIYDITDINGKLIVQELINLARTGGGFLEYSIKDFNSGKVINKITYVQKVKDWNWMISTAVNIDDIKSASSGIDAQPFLLSDVRLLPGLAALLLITGVAASFFISLTINKDLSLLSGMTSNSLKLKNTKPFEKSGGLILKEFSKISEFRQNLLNNLFGDNFTTAQEKYQFKTAVDNFPHGVFACDASNNNKIIIWNRRLAAVLGFPPEDTLGKTVAELSDNPYLRPLFRYFGEKANIMPFFETETEALRGRMDIRVTQIPVFNEYGDVELVLGIVEDITLSKRLEQDLLSKTEQLEAINKNLESTISSEMEKRRKNEHLLFEQSKLAAMGQMINSIAHQWRQPINALGLYIQDLEESYHAGEADSDYVSNMTQSCMHLILYLSKIIDDFRNFYSSDELKENFNIAGLVFESVAMIGAKAEFNHIELYVKAGDKEPIFINSHIKTDDCTNPKYNTTGYPSEFKQVILNLLNNSLEAIQERKETDKKTKGMIIIFLRAENGNIIVTVKDNGGGIPEHIFPNIFDPYFTTKEPGKGTGVGLYMCKTAIETHMNGSISARNENDGAVLTITIPSEQS